MTCADARNIILSADPAALRDRTDPVLRNHLESCSGCSAAASHVVADVDRLRAALIARGARVVPIAKPRRAPKRVAMSVVPVALAAELALFAFLGARDNPNPLASQRMVIDDSVTSLLPVEHIDTTEATVAPAPKQVAASQRQPDSVSHRDSVAKKLAAAEPSLQVMPIARQQYVVMATSNPKVTVVWLTKGDTL